MAWDERVRGLKSVLQAEPRPGGIKLVVLFRSIEARGVVEVSGR